MDFLHIHICSKMAINMLFTEVMELNDIDIFNNFKLIDLLNY